MRKVFIAFFVAIIGMTILLGSVQADQLKKIGASAWEPESGDYFVVDTTENAGYLVHADNSSYYKFQVITGQQRYVWYIGRSYFAATPERTWEVESAETKGDRVTFGPAGTFLRLFYEGESTAYGIHSHKYVQEMFEKGNRYQSMGCIIVKDNFLNLIHRTFELNDNYLRVITTKDANGFEFLN
ncbi:L,D-transpeptidase [Candidatus Peregrinibacteria bacterium]|nr:L,D-transpeptidase [Candidatus Peregrinibacteria bacterium]